MSEQQPSKSDRKPGGENKLVGIVEVVALLSVASIAVGLAQLHPSLPWIWIGSAGLVLVWLTATRPRQISDGSTRKNSDSE